MTLSWDRLSAEEQENLCHELLLQDGMESITWLDTANEISMVALRPLEDRSNDLFLISIGGGLADDFTVKMWAQDFQSVFPRISGLAERKALRRAEGRVVLNLLFVWTPEDTDFNVTRDDLQDLYEKISAIGKNLFTIRCTVWNRKRLESLVRQHPVLVRKYFTNEWRSGSGGRKTTEALYRESVEYCTRAARAAQDLEKKYGVDPGKKWQDLAYTATHSIGNAIFPVETYVDYLRELMEELDHEDGKMAVDRAWTNVEKAKVHIRKFKSIASSREHWNLTAVDIVPNLKTSLDTAASRGIQVSQFLGEHPLVRADRDLVDEIIDELVANAATWLEGVEAPQLTVTLKLAGEDDLSPFLAGSKEHCPPGGTKGGRHRPLGGSEGGKHFLWLRFEDNGPGIDQDMKEKVFDLFFSRSSQGMGFGLAIVRKSMRVFGGDVVETGTPGTGARFDLFFPMAAAAEPFPDVAAAPQEELRPPAINVSELF
jgi:hypothetical protein